MPNILDASGLTTMTRAELVTYFTAQYQAIYGADINLSSDTPDGQMMNIFIQAILDLEDLLTQIYNTFDPDNAVGNVLDQRVAINGIQRQAGTFTVTNITIINTQSVNLYGQDQTAQDIYTVADNAGNKWQLQTTVLGVAAGTHSYAFQALVPGAQLTIPNTINVPVTIVLGVSSVNNPTTYTTLGINEETDAVLKVRRLKSVSLASQGYLAGLLAALENIDGVTAAFVYENKTNSTNVDGVPGHSIWVIVGGSGAAADIANAIYTKRNAGVGMYGSIDYTITQVDGTMFTVSWDDVVAQNLFITFTATSLNGTAPPNIAAITAGLPTLFTPGVNAEVNVNGLATLVQEIDPNTLVTSAGFSLAQTQVFTFSAVPAGGQFFIVYNNLASAAILWNDNAAAIQTKVRAVSGLSTVVVTGTYGTAFTFDLSTIVPIQTLLAFSFNTLLDGGAAVVNIVVSSTYTTTLSPSTKKNQFVVASGNIVVTPMISSPATPTSVVKSTTTQFTISGGYGELAFKMVLNASGGSVGATTGLYTAGGSLGTDSIKVTDGLGNTLTITITVTN